MKSHKYTTIGEWNLTPVLKNYSQIMLKLKKLHKKKFIYFNNVCGDID